MLCVFIQMNVDKRNKSFLNPIVNNPKPEITISYFSD